MNNIFIIVISLGLISCATSHFKNKSWNNDVAKLAPKKVLDVPFVAQDENYCGPASLAMIYNYLGENTNQFKVGDEIITPKAFGTFQTDMIASIRGEEFLALKNENFSNILKEVNDNRPVLVFLNLGFDWYPLWHYAVVVGYNLEDEVILLHSGKEKYKKQKFEYFYNNWRRANKWSVIVLKPGELASFGNPIDYVREGAHLEVNGKIEKAIKVYESVLKKYPNSGYALAGLGNAYFKMGDYVQSYDYLQKALNANPNLKQVRNNLEHLKNLADGNR